MRPEFQGFMSDYYRGLMVPDHQRWVTDIKTVFGAANDFRKDHSQMTDDSWANYDRIAPVISARFAEWQRGDLKPTT